MRKLLVLLLVFGVGGVQSPPTPSSLRITSSTITPLPELYPNEPFRVVFNHWMTWYQYDTTKPEPYPIIPCAVTGGSVVPPAPNCFGDTTEYRLLINNVHEMTKAWTQAGNGYVEFFLSTGKPAGSYSIVIQAVGSGGITGSTAITLPVVQR